MMSTAKQYFGSSDYDSPYRPVGSIRIKLADINPPELLDKIEREVKEGL